MEETVQSEVREFWYVIPGIYEKWRHPSNKNDKHYRVIFRSNIHKRRVSKAKFKRAFDAKIYAAKFDIHLCTKRETNAIQ